MILGNLHVLWCLVVIFFMFDNLQTTNTLQSLHNWHVFEESQLCLLVFNV